VISSQVTENYAATECGGITNSRGKDNGLIKKGVELRLGPLLISYWNAVFPCLLTRDDDTKQNTMPHLGCDFCRFLTPFAGFLQRTGASTRPRISPSHVAKSASKPGLLSSFSPLLSLSSPFRSSVIHSTNHTTCLRCSLRASGYLNRPDLTAKAWDKDGFYHTGDIGELLDATHVRIIDRKKNVFKLSNGEWCSPENVEKVGAFGPHVFDGFDSTCVDGFD
jgi:acyl-CoA synthetase (AMP-forming)/AMP-acid ligase II